MRVFALHQIAALLERLAHQVHRTIESRDADAVHDLRVTIRRFGQSLRVFAPFIGKRAAKKVRKQLRRIMSLAGEVRNRDITMLLVADAGQPQLIEPLRKERDLAVRILVSELERWVAEHEAVRWRAALELPSQ